MNVFSFQKKKQAGKKITVLTCYDYWSAKILEETEVDAILVGDSLAMVMHGAPSTLSATIEVMKLHTLAVVKGAPNKFVIADLPFLSYRKDLTTNMDAIHTLMATGAHAVKLEGAHGNLELIRHTVDSGVPVMGHIGLTPQSINTLGGFKVQGRDKETYDKLKADAKDLEQAGCFSIVLECVPSALAREISEDLKIPTIGIGGGPDTDGQVLVLHDMLGLNKEFKPKFLREYLSGADLISKAVNKYCEDVHSKSFPSLEESYE